jgi:hypothetical protein
MGKWKKVISTPCHKGVNYTNKTIGNWTVRGLASNTGAPHYRQIWDCTCDCGERRLVDKDNVLNGTSQGCRSCAAIRIQGNGNPNWKGFENIPGSYFCGIVDGAKARNIPVSLTIEQTQKLWEDSKGVCALSGISIEMGKTASLDRIDSGKGYSEGNLQWVHKDVNRMKNHFPQGYFISICKKIAGRN